MSARDDWHDPGDPGDSDEFGDPDEFGDDSSRFDTHGDVCDDLLCRRFGGSHPLIPDEDEACHFRSIDHGQVWGVAIRRTLSEPRWTIDSYIANAAKLSPIVAEEYATALTSAARLCREPRVTATDVLDAGSRR